MAALRVLLRGSRLTIGNGRARGYFALLPDLATRASMAVQRRQLITTIKLQQEITQTPSEGPEVPLTSLTTDPTGRQARSVAIFKLNRSASPAEIREFIQSKGFDITHLQLSLDRFTFKNDSRCYIEFASEEQAQKAVKELKGAEFMNFEIDVRPLMENFSWGFTRDESRDTVSRFFYAHDSNASDALKPLFERRRLLLSVQTPGWGPGTAASHKSSSKRIIDETFGKYGIESLGVIQPFFFGDRQQDPRMLCFIDFKTKSGADQAVQDVHDTEIQGRRVWLRQSDVSPWKAFQIGKIDQELLSRLKAEGLVPKEPYRDAFENSDRRRGKEMYMVNRSDRTRKRREARAKAAQEAESAGAEVRADH